MMRALMMTGFVVCGFVALLLVAWIVIDKFMVYRMDVKTALSKKARDDREWKSILARMGERGYVRDIPPTVTMCVIDEGDVRYTYTRNEDGIDCETTVLMVSETGAYADIPIDKEQYFRDGGYRRANEPEPEPVIMTKKTRAISFEE
jgi:hypothetical protein